MRRYGFLAVGIMAACVATAPPQPSSHMSPADGVHQRVHTRCVVQTSDFDVKSTRPRDTEGRLGPETRTTACYANAACIAHHGIESEGDALVENRVQRNTVFAASTMCRRARLISSASSRLRLRATRTSVPISC